MLKSLDDLAGKVTGTIDSVQHQSLIKNIQGHHHPYQHHQHFTPDNQIKEQPSGHLVA